MRNYYIAGFIGALVGLGVTLQFAEPIGAQEAADASTTYEQLDLFGDIFERIRSGYVEEVDEKKLIEAAINGMLSSLDPHSSYMPPEAFADMRSETRGEFGGLGIEVTQEDGFVKVVSPIDDTPASRAGILSGDFITHVNGEQVLGLTLDQSVEMMKGPVGSEVVITIVREGTDQPFDVTLTRDTIEVSPVRARLEGQTIVVRISSFTEQTYKNLEEDIKELVVEAGGIEKVEGFVLDLRNNPGGLLTQAVDVSDAFLDAGEIVSTRGRSADDSERYNATEGDLALGKPLVVLINSGSASASEIVAGALQDQRRAVVVGTRSFGKGSVQTILPMQGDGALRMTTARYYTPSGRSIQTLGVAPDIIVEYRAPVEEVVPAEGEAPASESEFFVDSESDLRGSLNNDSLTEDELKLLTEERAAQEATAKLHAEDNQLGYALDFIHGLAVLQPAN